MTRSEVFRQALQDIYSESRSLQEFAAEYGIAVRHVRCATGYAASRGTCTRTRK